MQNPCDHPLDVLGGAVIPGSIAAVSTVVNGQIVWTTNPPIPIPSHTRFLLLQSGGPLLVDEELPLTIE
jgi:hypothetical protein